MLDKLISNSKAKVAIIGLGYVGRPLLEYFSMHFSVIGYDINIDTTKRLSEAYDQPQDTNECRYNAKNIQITDSDDDIASCDIYIVTVQTPIDKYKRPDLQLLVQATEMIGTKISSDNLVIFESTVYPGTTQDICVKILENQSGLVCGEDFYVGYSPERISPGKFGKEIADISKLISGNCTFALKITKLLYQKIINSELHECSSIKVAETSKVLENIQRDVNIALINEVSKICSAAGIPIYDVLSAAKTKWNFLDFQPGLVGGHCIGIDPYYLVHKAVEYDITPALINTSRICNEGMVEFFTAHIMKISYAVSDETKPKILIVGLTFKEDCDDIRNSKQIEILKKIAKLPVTVHGFDPLIDGQKILKEHPGLPITEAIESGFYDCVALLNPHDELKKDNFASILRAAKKDGIIFDLKNSIPKLDPRVVTL